MEGLGADVRRLDAKLDSILQHLLLSKAPATTTTPTPMTTTETLFRASGGASGAMSPERQRIRAVLNYVPT